MGAELRPADSGTAMDAVEGLASKAAADAAAGAMRDAGIGTPNRDTVAQAAVLLKLGLGRVVALGVAAFFGCLLAAGVIAGVWMVSHRVSEIERKVDEFEVVKKRQDALVVHLLASVELIAQDMEVVLPRPPAVLRIAEAQAAQAASQ